MVERKEDRNIKWVQAEKWIIFFYILLSVIYFPPQVYSETWNQITQKEHSPDSNTVLLMHFNEGSGHPQDSSSYGNHVVLGDTNRRDASEFPSWTTSGKFGNALTFDGVNDFVHCGHKVRFDSTDAITIEAWVKGLADVRDVGIVDKGDIYLRLGGTGGRNGHKPMFSTGYETVIATTEMSSTEWHHIAGTYDGETLRIYVDGIEENTEQDIHGLRAPNVRRLIIGNRQNLDCPSFKGTIDEVRIRKMVGKRTVEEIEKARRARRESFRWVHPLCQPLAIHLNKPLTFVALADGSLMAVNSDGICTSKDDGKTWSETRPVCEGIKGWKGHLYGHVALFDMLQTRSGVLVMVYRKFTDWKFSWDKKTGNPKDDCVLEAWAIRSLDNGKTWVDQQRILGGYVPNFFGFIQTRSGRLVTVSHPIVRDPGRYVSCSLTSDDDGKTWKRSNLIDLGGHGGHGGALEPTVAELSDGRLLMLIRTSWGRFWEAFSEDGGLNWRTIQPSRIKSSHSPGYLLKLRSGRLVLVYNGKSGRESLFIIFSEDDGRSWTKPLRIASQKGGQLSYPYIFERRAGELWILAGFSFADRGWSVVFPLRLRVNEEELRQAVGSQKME